MKRTLSVIAAIAVAATSHVWAQSGQADPFSGTWRLNVERSNAAWLAQPRPKAGTPQPQSFALVTIKASDETVDYSVEYARGKEAHKKASYTAKYNDAKWQDVRGTSDGFSSLTLVKSTDRIRYSVTRGHDGQFAGLIYYTIAEDGRSLTSAGLSPDGYVQYVRVFDKQ
jgi:hypothetical protein